MTDPASMPLDPGPLHPVTRLGRVLQQVRSFNALHGAELEGLAAELDAAGLPEFAARLRIFRDLQAQEAGLILDELSDVQADLNRATVATPKSPLSDVPVDERRLPLSLAGERGPTGGGDDVMSAEPISAPRSGSAEPIFAPRGEPWTAEEGSISDRCAHGPTVGADDLPDPAAHSPKRTRWLAEQARQAEEATRPRSRRDLFRRGD